MPTVDTQIFGVDDNLLCDEAVQTPQQYFARLREMAPVYWNDRHRTWVLTRHRDIVAAARDPQLTAERISPFLERVNATADFRLAQALELLQHWLVFKDPPDHTRLRRLVSRAFTPTVVRERADVIGTVVDGLLDEFADQPAVDLVRRFAYPLPAVVIAQMLGVPPEDRDLFKAWSDQLTTMVFGATDRPDRFELGAGALLDLAAYLLELVAQYENRPGDNLISLLLEQEEDDALSREELVATCTLLLFGGHETTTNLIANGVLALLEHPSQLARLRDDPSLLAPAIEEFLRFDGPARATMRIVREDHEFAGALFLEGQRVLLVNLAGNRDPEEFPEPNRLDITRAPNNHLGFGFGLHHCLGAPLARLEAQVAIGRLLNRFPKLGLGDEKLDWHPTMLSRGLTRLPVRLR